MWLVATVLDNSGLMYDTRVSVMKKNKAGERSKKEGMRVWWSAATLDRSGKLHFEDDITAKS